MSYRLALYDKKQNEYMEIYGLSQVEGLENIDETSLQNIVEFTSSFIDEEGLKSFLVYNNLLRNTQGAIIDLENASFGIHYYKNKESAPRLLPYGISYINERKYFDLKFLKEYFRKRLANPTFSRIFIEKYYSKLREGIFSSSVLYDLNKISVYFTQTNELSEASFEKIATAIQLYCQDKNTKGNYATSFSKLRELAMFAIHFERTHGVEEKYDLNNPRVAELLSLKNHYENLLNDDTLLSEEKENYRLAIKDIEEKIAFESVDCMKLARRQDNETTTN